MEKNDDKEKPRLSFFSVSQKHGCWFFGVASIGGIIVAVSTFCIEFDGDWFSIFELIVKNISYWCIAVGFVLMTLESFTSLKQRCLDKRTVRNRRIAEEIRWAVERGRSNPNQFNEEVENHAFRLLEKHRPPRFSKIRRRKSREFNKKIARDSLRDADQSQE